jgi:hypothetical protein
VLVVNYPTVIDITGKLYGLIINVFDKPENKNFYLRYAGVQDELGAYNNIALEELKNYKTVLRRRQDILEAQLKAGESYEAKEYTDAEKEAKKEALLEVKQQLSTVSDLTSGKIGSAFSNIFDFFKLPTVRIIRYIIDLVRNLALSFLVVVGCLAIMFECIPVFKGILNKWFKFYTAVTFWALTVCVLDTAFLSFAESGVVSAEYFQQHAEVIDKLVETFNVGASTNSGYIKETTTEITNFGLKWYAYGGTRGLNVAVNVVMVIFYCIVPFLTSLYIGGEQAGMFMSKVIGVGSMATQQIVQTAAGGVGGVATAAGAGLGGYKGGMIGQGIGSVVGAAGGMAGMVTSAGSGSN